MSTTPKLSSEGCFVLGPAWSGKTSFVVNQLRTHERITWIGTALVHDSEMNAHINSIKSFRPKTWSHLDESKYLIDALRAQSSDRHPLVIDSASQWMMNEFLLNSTKYDRDQLSHYIESQSQEFLELIKLMTKSRQIIVVSAEMGSSLPPEQPLAYDIRRKVGEFNQKLAAHFKHLILVQAGVGTLVSRNP